MKDGKGKDIYLNHYQCIERSEVDNLSREDFEKTIRGLKSNEVVGPDGIRQMSSSYKHALLPGTWKKQEMFLLIPQFVYLEQTVNSYLPYNMMATRRFKMMFKNKESPNDPSKYQYHYICLVNHTYKVIVNINIILLDATRRF